MHEGEVGGPCLRMSRDKDTYSRSTTIYWVDTVIGRLAEDSRCAEDSEVEKGGDDFTLKSF